VSSELSVPDIWSSASVDPGGIMVTPIKTTISAMANDLLHFPLR
jgi:hypothetical protein